MTQLLADAFAGAFARAPDLSASAPGRVNLLGEHTDYNGGFVLPIAIPQRTEIALAARDDTRVNVLSTTLGKHESYELGAERTTKSFIDYVQGVTSGLAARSLAIRGFDAAIQSSVPVGSGLSSSAALSVALLRGLRELYGLALDDISLARIAQWGENHVVGAPVGIMDPMACHLAGESRALFLDTRTLEYERLPLPSDAELVVVNSGVSHDHAGGGYRERRAECQRACELLGVRELRDVSESDLPRAARLPAPLDRRVRHVVTENQRVLAAAECLKTGAAAQFGALFDASHVSMRDDFEVSVPEVDALVERARSLDGVWGARLTGGGFGGSIVCLVECGRGLMLGQRILIGAASLLVPEGNFA